MSEQELELQDEVVNEPLEVEEPQEAEEYELTLEGDEEPPKEPELNAKALVHKLGKQRKRAAKAEQEAQAKDSRIEELERQVAQLSQANAQPAQPQQPQYEAGSLAPMPPDKWSAEFNGDDAKHAQAMAVYYQNLQKWQEAQRAPQVQQQQQQDRLNAIHQRSAEAVSQDAVDFIKESNINAQKVIAKIQEVQTEIDSVTGVDGGFNLLASRIAGGGGSKVAYFLANPKNVAHKNKVLKALEEDPDGFLAVSVMTDLRNRLNGKSAKKVSEAPLPDEAVKGDGPSVSPKAAELQAQYDKAVAYDDVKKIRDQAKELGITLVNR